MKNLVTDGNVLNWKNDTGKLAKSGQVVVVGQFVGLLVADTPDGGLGAVNLTKVYRIYRPLKITKT